MSKPENLSVFNTEALVASYNSGSGLTAAEKNLFDRWIKPGGKTLDIGVGTGRTYPYLSSFSSAYTGIDYSEAMIEHSRTYFPEGDFRVMDASNLSAFSDESFDNVVFSYNGIDYLHPYQKRLLVYKEVLRVLKPGGVFIFSSHNARAIIRNTIKKQSSKNSFLKRIAISTYASMRAMRHLLFTKVFYNGFGYTVDRIQPLLTFYCTPSFLRNELNKQGFLPVEIQGSDFSETKRVFENAWNYVAAIKPMHKSLSVHFVEGIKNIEVYKSDWDNLSKKADLSVFQNYAWFYAWVKEVYKKNTIRLLIATDDETGAVTGLLPIVQLKRNIHRILPVSLSFYGIGGSGSGGADHLGPVTNLPEAAAKLFEAAIALDPSSSFYFESLQQKWAGLAKLYCEGKHVRTTICPAIVKKPDASFSEQQSSKMKKNVRRRLKLMEEAQVHFKWIGATDNLFKHALFELKKTHELRWQQKNMEGLFDSNRVSFIFSFSRLCEEPDMPWVLLMQKNEKTIGALLGFRHQSTFSVYKTGWDPSYHHLSTGILLGNEAMRWAAEEGLTCFDYLRGPRGHKKDFGCKDVVNVSILKANGISGFLLCVREKVSKGGVWNITD